MDNSGNSSTIRHRVLILASTYPRWSGDHEPGFVHELNRRLVDAFDVHVVCPHAPGAARQEVLDGVTVHRFRYAPEAMETLVQDGGILTNLKHATWKWGVVPFFFFGLLAETFRQIRLIRPNCIHAHWIIPQGLALSFLGVLYRKMPPFLLTSHGGDLFSLRGRLFRMLKSRVLKKAAAVTVVSRPMLAEILKLGVHGDLAWVIPMGVDFDGRFSLEPNTERIAGQILFVGRLVEKKGVKYLIQALPLIRQRVPNAHLLIIGSGPDLGALVTLVSRLGLQDCVAFRGAMPQEALPKFYRRATVFVAPFVSAASGDREGLGLVSIEALACGCPVVVGDVPVVSDIFLDSEMDMRSIPGNPESLAQKIGDILVNPEMAIPRALVVRQRLSRQVGWDTVASRYIALLQSMVRIS